MENGVTEQRGSEELLPKLVQFVESAEESTQEERADAEKARDYYDGKQLTEEELAILAKRGQPPVIINRIKRKIDFLTGHEVKTRTDPKAMPRTPKHEDDAGAATDSIRFVCDNTRYDSKRSDAWENLVIEGLCAIEVGAVRKKGQIEVEIKRIPWDRIIRDPHSSERDFSDARYMGYVIWMDYEAAVAKWPDRKDVLETSKDSGATDDTYDDKPKWKIWGDGKRKRVKVVRLYFLHNAQWHWATFVKGGYLDDVAVSPFLNEDQEPECPIHMQSAFIDRDNNRYGVVKEMISPQDEINKRRSKALHAINSRQTMGEEGAVKDVRKMKTELAKPDGHVEYNTGRKFEVIPNTDIVGAQFQLLQESKDEIDGMGANATLQGKQGPSLSGRAQALQQQAGLTELGRLNDARRDLDLRVYIAIWNRIRQFWTEERWVRVTDDENNARFVPINSPKVVDTEFGPIVDGVQNEVGQLDVDIIVEQGMDTVTLMAEEFDQLSKMPNVPLPVLLEFSSLRGSTKEKLLKSMESGNRPPPGFELELAKKEAEVAETHSKAELNHAKAQSEQMPRY